MILVRHAHAGTKAAWRGDDEMRPVSTLGLAQAQSLVATLHGETITALWCSPSVRCRQTLEPLAAVLGLPVRTSAHLSKTAHPTGLLTWLQQAGVQSPWVVCTHGEVLTALYATARPTGIIASTRRTTTEKGALWRLTVDPHDATAQVQLAYTPPTPRR